MPTSDMPTSDDSLIRRFRAGQIVSAATVLRALDELQRAAPDAGQTASRYIPSTLPAAGETVAPASDECESFWQSALETAGAPVLSSKTGVAAFRAGNAGLAVLPTLPLRSGGSADGIDAAPLQELLASEYTVGVALLRLGRYAIGVYQGKRLLVSKTDTRYVKGRHHAGGTSQRRFQRVREQQIHRLYVKASGILTEQWRPFQGQLDYAALGGEAATIAGFVKECRLLQTLSPITLPRRLDVREPNRAALQQAGAMLYECQVYPLSWAD